MKSINEIQSLFTETYHNNKWGSSESFSGVGSQLNYTYNFRTKLEETILTKKIKTIFDCSCGDWNWMSQVSFYGAKYIGNDIVPDIVERNKNLFSKDNITFINNDCLSSLRELKDKSIDLIICRHTLEHLETEYCIEVCKEIQRVGKYALITSNNTETGKSNIDLDVDGHSARQIDLEKPPFLKILKKPIKRIWDSKACNQNNTSQYNGINFYKFGQEI